MSRQISVIIIDRHRLVGEGLAKILANERDMRVIDAGGEETAALEQAAKNSPTVTVVDAALPNVDALTRRLLALRPAPQVLVLAADCQVQQALTLLGSGAIGYLCKDTTPQDFISAVRHASRQEMVLDPAVAKEVVERLTHATRPASAATDAPDDVLTGREQQVLHLLCQGITDKAIADQLCISIRTVNGHLRHIYAKLGVHSRTEAMHLALEKGWVSLAIAGALFLIHGGQV